MGSIQQTLASFGGAATTFSPADIAGLTLWLKADAIVGLNDGDPVASWADSSGLSNTATGAAIQRPEYKTAIVNSLPVVRFNGTTNYLTTPSISAITAWTVFFVSKGTEVAANYFLDAADGSHSIISNFVAGKFEYYSSPRTVLGDASTSVFSVITCSVGGTSTGTWTAAAAAGGGDPWGGDIAEIIAYNSALSGGDTVSVQGYLATKYGL